MIRQPNILFLFLDSHRGDWMPYNADTFRMLGMDELPLRMPNIKKIMEEGVTFIRAVTPSPLCAPARACLAAGVRYDRCGTASNEENYPLNRKTFYSVLKEAGYRVGGVGKFDLHKPTHWWGLDGWIADLETLGFTDAIDNAGKIDAIVSGKECPRDPYMKYLYDHGLAELHMCDMNGRKGQGTASSPLPEEAYCDNWLTNNGINMLRQFPKNMPWFLQVNFTGPHGPWDITERMKQAWKNVEFPQPNRWDKDSGEKVTEIRQNYAAMLENIDRNIGLLLDEIKNRGEIDNTIVIYSSDHGEMLGDFNRFGKCVPYRGAVSIPLVISGPGIRKGFCSDALVELQDLAATISDYACTPMKEALDSISLKPVLEGRTLKHREYLMSALDNDGRHNRQSWKMYADVRYKMVVVEGKEPEIFDLIEDPWENSKVSGNISSELIAMKQYVAGTDNG